MIDFKKHLINYNFYIGYARYSQFPGNHVIVATQIDDGNIQDLVEDLSVSDCPAIEGANKLKEMEEDSLILISSDDNIIVAMTKLCDMIYKEDFLDG